MNFVCDCYGDMKELHPFIPYLPFVVDLTFMSDSDSSRGAHEKGLSRSIMIAIVHNDSKVNIRSSSV